MFGWFDFIIKSRAYNNTALAKICRYETKLCTKLNYVDILSHENISFNYIIQKVYI